MTKKRSLDRAITPDLRKRLEELFADSPLNDEPLTREQEEAIDRLMGRRPKASRARGGGRARHRRVN